MRQHILSLSSKCLSQEYTALPVLYASQWFLTCFSCPFPAKFACRVIDVLLQEQRPHVLLRVALAVVAECEADILQLHDFEDIITFLKVLYPLPCPVPSTHRTWHSSCTAKFCHWKSSTSSALMQMTE